MLPLRVIFGFFAANPPASTSCWSGGERVRVEVLHEEEQNRGGEDPLQLAEAGERDRLPARARVGHGDVPILPTVHLPVRPRGDRADVGDLQVQTAPVVLQDHIAAFMLKTKATAKMTSATSAWCVSTSMGESGSPDEG